MKQGRRRVSGPASDPRDDARLRSERSKRGAVTRATRRWMRDVIMVAEEDDVLTPDQADELLRRIERKHVA